MEPPRAETGMIALDPCLIEFSDNLVMVLTLMALLIRRVEP